MVAIFSFMMNSDLIAINKKLEDECSRRQISTQLSTSISTVGKYRAIIIKKDLNAIPQAQNESSSKS